MALLLRIVVPAIVFLIALPVRAELTCEQIVSSAQAAIAMRDQGASLGRVMAETDKPEMRERFAPDELAMIRQAIRLTFTGEVSIYEVADTCAESRGKKR